MLALVALGQFLGMTLWFSATAAAPRIASELALGESATAWLTIAVQGGFVAGTLISAVLNLADVFNARRLFAAGCVAGAAANAAIAWSSDGSTIIALRLLTGAALACVYPPGMKIAAGWFLERRGSALGVVVGALTLGSAFPHLLSWSAADLSWRTLMLSSSMLAVIGGAIVHLFVKDGPHVAASAPFDRHALGAVVRNRGARLATFGYLGHMWELYAMWAWIAAFAAASLAAAGAEESRSGSLVAFVAIASGAAGCVVAGRLGRSLGKSANRTPRPHHQRRLFGRRRAALRHAARGVTGSCGDLGLFRRCRLGAVLRAGQRIQRAHARRHRADTPNLRRLPVDDGEHETAAARRGQLWMAVGVPAARARPDPRRAGDESASPVTRRVVRGAGRGSQGVAREFAGA